MSNGGRCCLLCRFRNIYSLGRLHFERAQHHPFMYFELNVNFQNSVYCGKWPPSILFTLVRVLYITKPRFKTRERITLSQATDGRWLICIYHVVKIRLCDWLDMFEDAIELNDSAKILALFIGCRHIPVYSLWSWVTWLCENKKFHSVKNWNVPPRVTHVWRWQTCIHVFMMFCAFKLIAYLLGGGGACGTCSGGGGSGGLNYP